MNSYNSSSDEQFEDTRFTIAEVEWLRDCTSDELVGLITEWFQDTNRGDEFTIRELLGDLCDHIPVPRFRGACRKFKNRVTKKLITTVYYLGRMKRKMSTIYRTK